VRPSLGPDAGSRAEPGWTGCCSSAWAAVPVAGGLLPSAYLVTVGARPLSVRLLIGLVFAYAVVLAFWAVGRFQQGKR
jgi:hypothetical protein